MDKNFALLLSLSIRLGAIYGEIAQSENVRMDIETMCLSSKDFFMLTMLYNQFIHSFTELDKATERMLKNAKSL